MSINSAYVGTQPTLGQLLEALRFNINYNLNCVKVAKVEEFDPLTFTAKCRIMNKQLISLNEDGTQNLKEYPLIYAKVHNIGWGSIGITHPIQQGMEGLLLFNDREIQTWFITGENGQLAFDRCHDLTDALFICGLHSQPNIELVQYIENCLKIYYGEKNIQISEEGITINGNTTINGNLIVNGQIEATGDIIANGISLLNHVHGNGNQGNDTTGPK